jgi:hypothetical protein
MFFRIDKDTMRVLFTMGDRDLALAFAEMEGYDVVSWGPVRQKMSPSPVVFGQSPTSGNRLPGTQPEQVSSGVYSYRIAPKTRKTYAQADGRRKVGKRATRPSQDASSDPACQDDSSDPACRDA